MRNFRRVLIGAAIGVIVVVGVSVPVVGAMRDALQADIAWSRVDAPIQLRTRGDRFYPWSAPILSRWSEFGDDARAQYARETFARLGGPAAHMWFLHAIDTDADMNIGPDDFSDAALRAYGIADLDARRDAAERAAANFHVGDAYMYRFNAALLSALGPVALSAVEHHLDDYSGPTRERLGNSLSYERAAWTPEQRKRAANIEKHIQHEFATHEHVERRDPLDIAAEKFTHGDQTMRALFRTAVNGDLRVFSRVSYAPNLVAVAHAFPQSRLARGYFAYDAIRGGTYFSRDDAVDERIGPALAAPEKWRAWLAMYADHPGADDASYWLGRALHGRGERVQALAAYARALEMPYGDGDMSDVIAWRCMQLIDTGMRTVELDAYITQYPHGALTPLVRYARALRAARIGAFDDARRLTTIPDRAYIEKLQRLHIFYASDGIFAAWRAQYRQWDFLGANPQQLAAAWNDSDGWKIGYNVFFNGMRFGGQIADVSAGSGRAVVAENTRAANANAQRIGFADRILADARSDDTQKRAAYRTRIAALYRQIAEYPDEETSAMGALAEFSPAAREHADALEAWPAELLASVEAYARRYPDDDYLPTAFLCAFEVSDSTAYLDRAIKADPHGPRAEEARALLWRARKPR